MSLIVIGIKDFAIIHNGDKTSKYGNPRHLAKHQKNLKRKQQKLARKQLGSNKRNKALKLVAKVYERISNVRQDFSHKLSRKIVNNQVVVVENLTSAILQGEETSPNLALNIKGMVRNRKLAKSISNCPKGYRSAYSWGKFVNFLDYKLASEGKLLVEISR